MTPVNSDHMMNSAGRSQQIRIVIYTDQPLLAFGAAALLSSSAAFDATMADADVSRLVPLVTQMQPDLLLLDLTAEITIGLLKVLRATAPAARLILWGSKFSQELIVQARALGVTGFLPRALSNDQFLARLAAVAEGDEVVEAIQPQRSTKVDLTPRESQLVGLLAQGLRNKEIGSCLGITEGTVRIYLSRLFLKVGARDRLELAIFGLKNALCGQASWDGQNAFVTENDEERARPVLRSLLLVEPARRKGYSPLPQASGQ
jgi:DNA-binding NarL/FixJ family response regulator